MVAEQKTENWLFVIERALFLSYCMLFLMCIFHCLTASFFKGGKSKIYLLALYELIHLSISKSQSVNENGKQNTNMELQGEKIQKEQQTDMLIITTE